MSEIKIHVFRVGESNYNYILYNARSKTGIVIDPLEAKAVLQEIKRLEVKLKFILNTHGHWDHVAGNDEVKAQTGAKIVGGEREKIPDTDQVLRDGEVFEVDGLEIQVLLTPGHTAGHISLLVNKEFLLVGDTLFLGGCGNCKFGGDPDQLFESLERLKKLADSLRIYCGHEYALKNLDFCKRHDSENSKIGERITWVREKLNRKEAPITTLGEEKEHNVFLRTERPEIHHALKREFPDVKPDPRAVFKKLRELRNAF